MHLETPAGEEYLALADMAREYRDTHLVALKQLSHYNPRLGVDALCFQRLHDENDTAWLVGALITPCALWLLALPAGHGAAMPKAGEYRLVLPAGHYRLERHAFGRQAWYQRRILDDLGELGSMQEAARLAQQLMARLMQVDSTLKRGY